MEKQENKTLNPASSIQHPASRRGVALIIVIFAMMLFAVLGWTLTNLQSGDFEINLRNLDSERALGLAEAGVHWALNQLSTDSCWRTGGTCSSVDSDCIDGGDWLTTPHSLNPGEYNICCRNPTVTETGDAVIESRGYVSSQVNYRTMRQVKLEVTLGSLTKAVMTQKANLDLPNKGLFNWWPTARDGHSLNIDGDISAGHYEGDGDGIYDELAQDYDPPPGLLLPPTDGQRDFTASFPAIDMSSFYSNPDFTGWSPPRTATITGISEVVPGQSRVVVDSSIFSIPLSQWNTQALRNISRGSWKTGNWQTIATTIDISPGSPSNTVDLSSVVNWAIGDRVTAVSTIPTAPTWSGGSKTYVITVNCNLSGLAIGEVIRNFSWGSWNYSDWAVIVTPAPTYTSSSSTFTVQFDSSITSNPGWAAGNWIGEIKRYNSDGLNIRRYIMADTLIDTRPGALDFRNGSFISEGEMAIKGPKQVRFRFTGGATRYPNLATKYGDIISLDQVINRSRRDFNGIIYSEFGLVNLNYLTGTLVYGDKITLDGDIFIRYRTNRINPTGFNFAPAALNWREQ